MEINADGVFQISHIEISDSEIVNFDVCLEECYEYFPCDHNVTLHLKDGNNFTSSYIDGRQIAHLYQMLNKEMHPHFAQYATEEQQKNRRPITKTIKTPMTQSI